MQASDAAASGNRVLAMSTLGRNGRFGNQVFQYAFLRIYAHRHGLEVRVPEWIDHAALGHGRRREVGDRHAGRVQDPD